VHDAFRVQVANCQDDLECIEFDHGFRQTLLCLEDLVELAAADEWHHEVESLLCLEQVLHTYKKGVVTAEQDVLLQPSVLHLLKVEKDVFADGLDGVLLVQRVVDSLGQEHFSEGAFAKECLFLEVF